MLSNEELQRRFFEHQIRDEADFIKHMDYLHNNPLKYGLVNRVLDWQYSGFHRYVKNGIYSADWGENLIKNSTIIIKECGYE